MGNVWWHLCNEGHEANVWLKDNVVAREVAGGWLIMWSPEG